MSDTKAVNIGGLWLKKKADGEQYFMGKLGGATLFISKNKYKETDKHPDYVMSVAPPMKKEGGGSAPSGSGGF